jgi:hypothetical protein
MAFFATNALVFIAMGRKGGRGGVSFGWYGPVSPFRFSHLFRLCACSRY